MIPIRANCKAVFTFQSKEDNLLCMKLNAERVHSVSFTLLISVGLTSADGIDISKYLPIVFLNLKIKRLIVSREHSFVKKEINFRSNIIPEVVMKYIYNKMMQELIRCRVPISQRLLELQRKKIYF